MNVLIAYFSQTGNTRKIARTIAAAENADLEEITEAKGRYTGVGWYLTSGLSALLKRKSDILKPKQDPQDYDLIFIGTPVWAGRIPPAIRSYMGEKDFKGKKVALFCTMGGGNPSKTFKQMSKLLDGSDILGSLPVSDEELKSERLGKKIEVWLSRVTRRV